MYQNNVMEECDSSKAFPAIKKRENPQIKLHGRVCGFIEDFTLSPGLSFFKRKMGIFAFAEKSS